MFLDIFMDDASEGIMENPIPDLDDLQLECVVSLEAAYSDLMLEGCQAEFQAFVEGISAINEGVIESIKNFFKKLINAIKKFFGDSNSSGGGVSGNSVAKLEKQTNDVKFTNGLNYILKHPELSKRYRFIDTKSIIYIDTVNATSCLNAAIDRVSDDVSKNSGSKPDGDKMALDALRTFVNSAFKQNGAAEKINSLGDYRNALYDSISYVSLNDLFGSIAPNKVIHICLDKLYKSITQSATFSIKAQKQMNIFENIIIKKAEGHPEYVGAACKVAKTLSQAYIIYANYSNQIYTRRYNEFHQLFNAAMKYSNKN